MNLWWLFLFPAVAAEEAIRCMSIYGCETSLSNWVCSWKHDVEWYIEKLYDLQFNTLRLPFSRQYVLQNDFSNYDRAMNKAYELNMSVILDLHRIYSDYQDPTPFSRGLTMDEFKSTWFTMLDRYKWFPKLSMNAYNEYQLADPVLLNDYTRELFKSVEERYPDLIKRYYSTGTRWSGDLAGVYIDLPFQERVHYSIHKYWFSLPKDGTTDYEHDWDVSIPLSLNSSKIIVGEFGWKSQEPKEVAWAHRFLDYLKRRGIVDTCAWTVAHSTDTNGWWLDDCETFDWAKYSILKDFWFGSSRGHLRGSS